MVKKFVLLLSIIWSLSYSTIHAEEQPLVMDTLEIQVMPEFTSPENAPSDQPNVLVGMFGTIVNRGANPFTGDIVLEIPKGNATQVHLVGEFQDGQSTETTVAHNVDVDKGIISWKPLQPIKPKQSYFFVVEYYNFPFVMENHKRSFEFPVTSSYSINNLQVFVYKPLQAQNFQLSKKHQQVFSNEFGQEIFHFQVGAFTKGTTYSLNVSYEKSDNTTVVEAHTVQAKENVKNQATEEVQTEPQEASKDAWIIAGSIVIFGIFVFLGLRSYRKPVQQTEAKPQNSTKEAVRVLRKQLIQRDITEEEYAENRKKLIGGG